MSNRWFRMVKKQSFNSIVFVVAVSSLILSGCINSPQQGTTQPTATVQTPQSQIGLNDYLEEIKTRIHAFGPSNSSSSASIYISPGHEISLIVPLMLDENGKILKMYENPIITGNPGQTSEMLQDSDAERSEMVMEAML